MIITIFVILFFFILVLAFIIWMAIRGDRKIQGGSLSEDEKNQIFIKLILNITDELNEFKTGGDVNNFIEKTSGAKESFDEATSSSDYNTTALISSATGVVGAILGSSFVNSRNILTSINTTRNNWNEYLLNKVIQKDAPKEEKKRLSKKIENKINYLLNSKVLLATNQSYIKDAWEKILKDKTLKIDSLDKANLLIYRTLIDSNFHQQKNKLIN